MISWQPVMNKVYTMLRVLKLQIHPKYVWTSIIIIREHKSSASSGGATSSLYFGVISTAIVIISI